VLKIHTADGQTIRVDLSNPEQAREWLQRLEQDQFQKQIRGMALIEYHRVGVTCDACGLKSQGVIGTQYSLSRPQDFQNIRYEVERNRMGESHSERIVVTAGDVMLSVTAHDSQPSARALLVKSGRRRYVPRQFKDGE